MADWHCVDITRALNCWTEVVWMVSSRWFWHWVLWQYIPRLPNSWQWTGRVIIDLDLDCRDHSCHFCKEIGILGELMGDWRSQFLFTGLSNNSTGKPWLYDFYSRQQVWKLMQYMDTCAMCTSVTACCQPLPTSCWEHPPTPPVPQPFFCLVLWCVEIYGQCSLVIFVTQCSVVASHFSMN